MEYRRFARVQARDVLSYWLACLEEKDNETTALLQNAYQALQQCNDIPEILQHLFGEKQGTKESSFSFQQLQDIPSQHCAMVDRGAPGDTPLVFPLDASQRLALYGFLQMGKKAGAIAVNGAPGTGKTVSSVKWLKKVLRNVEQAYNYIAKDNPMVAVRVVLKIQAAINQLTESPFIGRPGRVEGTRELVRVTVAKGK
jgi:toxin ParE1/3/4